MTDAKKSVKKSTKKAAKKAAKKVAAPKADEPTAKTVEDAAVSGTASKPAKKAAAKKTSKKTTAKKSAKKTSPKKKAPAPTPIETKDTVVIEESPFNRTASETEELRDALAERLHELEEERRNHLSRITEAQRERLSDSAGDDQVDAGSKTVEHEQELHVVRSISERIAQVERALERLELGDYGICEKCAKPIPAARLAVFPSATLCVSCKQLEERR